MRYLSVILIMAFFSLQCLAKNENDNVGQYSKLNNQVLKVDSTGSYRFVVGGHFYGNSTSNSGFPASTLLGGLDRILEFRPNMLFVTGDLFLDVERDKQNYTRSLFNKLPFPIYNAVGNHDLDGDNYEPYGPTSFYFFVNDGLYIVLDTERDNGSIKGEQLDMLKRCLNEARNNNAKMVFLFSHRPVWANGHQELDELLKHNTRSLTGNNFTTELLPMLKELDPGVKVFWFAGSMGGSAPASFLYHEEYGINFIITAIRDTRRDAVLGVEVNAAGVGFTTLALGENKVKALEHYNLPYWQERIGRSDGFNFRLIPYHIKSIILHRAFWFGVLICALVFSLWHFLRIRSN